MNSDSESVGTSESLFQTSGRNVSGSVEKDGGSLRFLTRKRIVSVGH